jgi:hypothetical protein
MPSLPMSAGEPLRQRYIHFAVRHWGLLVSHSRCFTSDELSCFHLLPFAQVHAKPEITNHPLLIEATPGRRRLELHATRGPREVDSAE